MKNKIKVKSPSYSLVACDLSAAEVRTACNASKDPGMVKAYQEGKDLYSLIASKIYNNKYEDNLEFYPEGTKIMFEGKEITTGYKTHTNKAGKIRRQDSKSVLIGLIYGRGANSIKDQINESRISKGQPTITKEDAQKLIDNIYESFPRLKEWMDETHDFIHKNGYIDDIYGRRRRLPDGMLPKYTIETGEEDYSFNPILGCIGRNNYNPERKKIVEYWEEQLNNIRSFKDYEGVKSRALKAGVTIHDNQGYIAQAERQSVNFQAQAASSEINKKSMIAIDRDPRLKELGFQLLLTIHDEVIGQCPSENAEEVARIIPEIMTNVAKDKMVVPLVADASIMRHWYEEDLITSLNNTFNKKVEDGLTEEDAILYCIEEHPELLPNQISDLLGGKVDYLWA